MRSIAFLAFLFKKKISNGKKEIPNSWYFNKKGSYKYFNIFVHALGISLSLFWAKLKLIRFEVFLCYYDNFNKLTRLYVKKHTNFEYLMQ